jgi:hypothetical protein
MHLVYHTGCGGNSKPDRDSPQSLLRIGRPTSQKDPVCDIIAQYSRRVGRGFVSRPAGRSRSLLACPWMLIGTVLRRPLLATGPCPSRNRNNDFRRIPPPAVEPLLPLAHRTDGRRSPPRPIDHCQGAARVLRRISSRQTKRNAAKSVAEAGEVVRRWAGIAFQAGRPDR